ncbi:SET domain-containing protein [Solibacillus daqui]|uniref:SET domain-containing protein n=1 Tax=Solibacillus daqui TaxID=2912187 RepID=UPI0023671714|nr:SET domain-containing protein [Solibacillus daqui]
MGKGVTALGPICIKDTGKYGKGIYATRDIKKDELIEVSPVIILPKGDWKYLKKTSLLYYSFYWGKNDTAIALGFGSLFNHSYTPNTNFENNTENLSIDFYALNDILMGEELTINYNGDLENKSPLWFDVIE